MDITREQIHQEAAFADCHYQRYANDLKMNPRMFAKYSHPKELWDWRQYGATLIGPLKGARLLDLGCGMGEESVYFAKLGASVTAVDISPVGIDLTKARAVHNGVGDKVQAFVMRADKTDFADGSFDFIHGFGILHHIGLDQGFKEVSRLLRPGGRGLFFEHMGNSQYIEQLRGRKDYTEYEKPLKWKDLVAHTGRFTRLDLKAFHVFTRLRSLSPRLGSDNFRRLDSWLLRFCPPLRHFASGVVIYLEK
jgi:SAM-dependent methyltransferase